MPLTKASLGKSAPNRSELSKEVDHKIRYKYFSFALYTMHNGWGFIAKKIIKKIYNLGRQIYDLNPFKAQPKLTWDQGRKFYDLLPLRVQIYLGRFFQAKLFVRGLNAFSLKIKYFSMT